jgi:hypothetical protein
VPQTQDHLFRHCSRWHDQQMIVRKTVGQATGWKVGRCRQVQISERYTIEECDQAVMDFLADMEVGKFPPKYRRGMEPAKGLGVRGRRWRQWDYIILSFFLSFLSLLSFSHLSFVSGDEG